MNASNTNHIIHYYSHKLIKLKQVTIHYSFFCITNAEKGVGLM